MCHSGLNWVSMVVADGLVPMWHQEFGNNHDNIGWSEYTQNAP